MPHQAPDQIIEWRSLFLPRKVEKPTYASDIAGPLERFDERDTMFARIDLEAGTERYEAYYADRLEFQVADDYMRALPPLGFGAAPADASALGALFGSAFAVGRPVVGAGGGGETLQLGGPSERLRIAPDEGAVKLKAMARYLGADLVGVAPLNPAFVYSHVGRTSYGQRWGEEIRLDHTHAVVLGFAMDYDLLSRYAPGFPVTLETGLAYAKGALATMQLAMFIHGLGYSARAHHLEDNQALLVPLAVDAGLGELGRSGVLLTREFGSSLRLAAVTTDLPLTVDGPVDLGIQSFCSTCSMCAQGCPAGAIPTGEKIALRGVKRWKLAAGRCYHYWRQVGSDCALCLLACPWSRPDKLTRHLRPSHPEPALDAATLEHVRQVRSTLPAWLRRYLEKPLADKQRE
jgi:ferredoxin